MTRLALEPRRHVDGSIDYDFYKAQADKERLQTWTRLFRRMIAFLLGNRAPLPAKSRVVRIASVSY